MPVEDLPVPHHTQDTALLCGAACAKMVLDHLGAGVLPQSDLYNHRCHDESIETGWASSPNGLEGTLNDRRPPSFPSSFSLFALQGVDSISRKIVWTIHRHQAAAVALVQGGGHWIVVRGFEASAAPATATDVSYSISSFDVNDPAEGLAADQNISYSTWQNTYMTGLPMGHWQGRLLAVCDPDPAPRYAGLQAPPPRRLSGDQILTPRDEAREQAQSAFQLSGLMGREAWKESLLNTTPGVPILVQRLDRIDSFYYIVPMQIKPQIVTALVCIDARFGNYIQAARIPRRVRAWHKRIFDPEVALALVLGRQVNLRRAGRMWVRKEAFSLYPALVWRPCRESMSPYKPFFLVTIGSHRIYIRVDGRVFTRLHLHYRGI